MEIKPFVGLISNNSGDFENLDNTRQIIVYQIICEYENILLVHYYLLNSTLKWDHQFAILDPHTLDTISNLNALIRGYLMKVDENILALANDTVIKIWETSQFNKNDNLVDHDPITIIQISEGRITDISIDQGVIAVACQSNFGYELETFYKENFKKGRIIFYDAKTGNCLSELDLESPPVSRTLKFQCRGQKTDYLAVVLQNGEVKIWTPCVLNREPPASNTLWANISNWYSSISG